MNNHPRLRPLLLALALPLAGGCVTTDNRDNGDPIQNGQDKARAIVAEVQQIPPKVLPTLPARVQRSSFGPMHQNLDFVMYDCSYVLTPEGNRCAAGEIMTHAYDLQNAAPTLVHALLPESMLTFDPELDRLGLRSHFKFAGAERRANVSVIASGKDKIDFLVRYPSGTVTEANAAAQAYCSSQGRPASFAGVSVACIRPDKELLQANSMARQATGTKNGKSLDPWYTYAIMAFNCGNGSPEKPTKNGKATTKKP